MTAFVVGWLLGSLATIVLLALAGARVGQAVSAAESVPEPASNVRPAPETRVHCHLCGWRGRWRDGGTNLVEAAVDHLLTRHPDKARWPDGAPVTLTDLDSLEDR